MEDTPSSHNTSEDDFLQWHHNNISDVFYSKILSVHGLVTFRVMGFAYFCFTSIYLALTTLSGQRHMWVHIQYTVHALWFLHYLFSLILTFSHRTTVKQLREYGYDLVIKHPLTTALKWHIAFYAALSTATLAIALVIWPTSSMGKGLDGALWHIGAVVWFLLDFVLTRVVLVQAHFVFALFFSAAYMAILAMMTDSYGTIMTFYGFRTVHHLVGVLAYTVTPIGFSALYMMLSLFSILFKRVGGKQHNTQTHALLYVSDNTSIALPVTSEYGVNQ